MNGNVWHYLFGIAGILFGLMTPIYQGQRSNADKLERIADLTQANATKVATLDRDLREIETQFDWNRETRKIQFSWMTDVENMRDACAQRIACLLAPGGSLTTCPAIPFMPYSHMPNGGPHGKDR